ncbi:4-hydroxybutyrate coenzyme A transferase [Halotydeus destructor]|nr:4-hydroxybutyrate coenzyme A transferase [Halotydeus destructor]
MTASIFCAISKLPRRNLRPSCFSFHSYVAEPAHPIPGKKPRYVSVEEAVSTIKSGDNVYLHSMAATPKTAIKAMVDHGVNNKLQNVTCHNSLLLCDDLGSPKCQGVFRSNSVFVGEGLRGAVSEGRADFTPIFLQDSPQLFARKLIPLDIAIVHVSPRDKHGYHSLGVTVEAARAALTSAKLIIGQVNPLMPRTQGDALVHESHFDYLFECTEQLSELGSKQTTDDEKTIGKLIAENLIEDGATLQMGIGGIPDAVLAQLTGHKDLGIHTEMFSDGIIDLVKSGAISNAKKQVEKGKMVSTFVLGSRKLYDFVDDNPLITMRTCDYTNRESIITQNPKVTAINSCIEIDLVGNVVSDSIGTKVFSGFGGQVDFLRAAAMGQDGRGKPILAMSSATKKGKSKIVPWLSEGANVTATRAHVHYVVTEHGIAFLHGKNYRQRAHAMLAIAHPKHRESLEKLAYQRLGCMPSAD